jgi:hypothetical protein
MCGGRSTVTDVVGSPVTSAAITSGLRVRALADDPADAGGVQAEDSAYVLHEAVDVDVMEKMCAGMNLRKSANMRLFSFHSPTTCTNIHSSHAPLSPPLTPSSHPLLSYTPLIHPSHTLLSYTALIHSPHILLSYSPLIHSILSRSLDGRSTMRSACAHCRFQSV